jgi:hypothetical protein
MRFSTCPVCIEEKVRELINSMINISCGKPKGNLAELYKVSSQGVVEVQGLYKKLEEQCRFALGKIS